MLKALEDDHFNPKETNDFILEKEILNFDFNIKKLIEEEFEKEKKKHGDEIIYKNSLKTI
jgi:hypothetical protein